MLASTAEKATWYICVNFLASEEQLRNNIVDVGTSVTRIT